MVRLYSRHIVGWDVQDHMEEELIISAFEKGITKRRPPPGLITHSHGSGQCAAKKFRRRLQHYGYLKSITRRDKHYDNTSAESLFSRIKAELLDGGMFTNVSEARLECFDYIECYYNPIRKHSSLGYKSPLQFERECGC